MKAIYSTRSKPSAHKETKKPCHDRPTKCPAVMNIEIEKASAEDSEIEAV
jgi:hypothetical protein